MNESRNRIYIKKEVLQKQLDTIPTWAHIKDFKFEDTDEILCEYVEAYYSENNSWNAHYMITVYRNELETEDQFLKRCKREDDDAARIKKHRYEAYLKFIEEFGPVPVVSKEPTPISESDIRRETAISLITKIL